MTKSPRRLSPTGVGLEALKELFGDDVEKRIANNEVSLQTCIVSGCKHTFWIPYGRYCESSDNINRGVCGPECDAAYRLVLQEKALAAEAALFPDETKLVSVNDTEASC